MCVCIYIYIPVLLYWWIQSTQYRCLVVFCSGHSSCAWACNVRVSSQGQGWKKLTPGKGKMKGRYLFVNIRNTTSGAKEQLQIYIAKKSSKGVEDKANLHRWPTAEQCKHSDTLCSFWHFCNLLIPLWAWLPFDLLRCYFACHVSFHCILSVARRCTVTMLCLSQRN